MALLQETGRGTSEVPMIMGILGAVMTIPGIICAGMCAAAGSTAEVLATGQSSGVGSFWMILNIAAAVLGLFFGITSKSTPRTSGVFMLSAAALTLVISFLTLNWMWGLMAVACFAIGGAISLTQDKISA